MSVHKFTYLESVLFAGVLMLLHTTNINAETPACGTTLTADTIFDSDMNCPSTAIHINAGSSNKVLDCAGFSINTTSNRAINGGSASEVTIKNCMISTAHRDGRGMQFGNLTLSTISGNTISTTGRESRGMDFRDNSSSNLIIDNTVHTTGSSSLGIRFQVGSHNNTVTNNTFQADASYAVNIQSASGNVFTGNTLISQNGYLFQGQFNLQNGGMSVDNAGNIYAVENDWGSSNGIGEATAFFLVDPVTGVANSVIPLLESGVDVGFGFDALEVMPGGQVLALRGGGENELYEINRTTGELTRLVLGIPANMEGSLNGLEATGVDSLLATTNTGQLISIIGDLVIDAGNYNPDADDLWNINQGAVVTDSSPLIGGSDIGDMFGGEAGSVESGKTLFADDLAVGTVHYVEWQTPAPVTISNFRLFANADGDTGDRSFKRFSLFARDLVTGNFKSISEFSSADPYTDTPCNQTPSGFLEVSINTPVTTAQEFRAEFEQFAPASGASGPRIRELDGFADPDPEGCILPSSNVATIIGDSGIGWTGLAIHPTSGKAYTISRWRDETSNTAHLYEINLTDGQIIGEIGDTDEKWLSDIDFAPDGTLYGTGGYGLIVIDIATGSGTAVGDWWGGDPLEPHSENNTIENNVMQTDDGSIAFTESTILPSAEADISSTRVEIGFNEARVDSTALPFLDTPARITLTGLSGSSRSLLVDPEDDGSFVPCLSPQCTLVSFGGGELVFDVTGFSTYSSIGDPVPDVKANGSDGPLQIAFGSPLQVDISLESHDAAGQAADWWLVAEAPDGRYWYDLSGSWVKSASPIPTYGGTLFDIASRTVLESSNLPIGSYRIDFGVDTNANGVLDFDALFVDSVDVDIQ